MTVTIYLLQTILNNHPVVPSHLIHSAGQEACLSGTQRLRDLHKDHGVVYSYSKKDHEYTFETSKDELRAILKGYLSHGRGGVGLKLQDNFGKRGAPVKTTTLCVLGKPSRPAPNPFEGRLF